MENTNLLESEKSLVFKKFSHTDALNFGLKAIEMIEKLNQKPIRIRVKYNNDIVFQYLMDGKVGETWLDRKEKTVLEAKHSSLYVYYHPELYPQMQENDAYALCGGGFPLIENDEIKGVFCISGLKHYEDHDLIISVLKTMLNK